MGQTGSQPFEGQVVQTLSGHSRAVLHCEFSQDGELLATCSADTSVLLWNVSTGEPLRSLQGHTADVTGCCFYQNILATCSKDKTVMLWLYESGRRASRLGKASTLDKWNCAHFTALLDIRTITTCSHFQCDFPLLVYANEYRL